MIELLVVVGVIGILASIALPNFLEAQTRSKVSRVKSGLRTVATALEAYHVDYKHYPPWLSHGMSINPTSRRLIPLTTPRAFVPLTRGGMAH